MESVDIMVIGAGVVGLSIALEAAARGYDVLVLERAGRPGQGVSARNSGVVHAGLYYPDNSLKSYLCIEGNRLLYDFCAHYRVPHARLGKWVVATTPLEIAQLEKLAARAVGLGLSGVEVRSGPEVMASEPHVSAVAGLWSPTSGIVGVPALLDVLEGRLQHAGGQLVCHTRATRITPSGKGFIVRIGGDLDAFEMKARVVVNAAGLGAQGLARIVEGLESRFIPARYLSKGNYFAYHGPSPFRHLIYPVPEAGGLGIHATLDVAGMLRFGPDVEAVNEISYEPNGARHGLFLDQVRRYFPSVDPERLAPDFAAIRPKIVPADQTADFCIQGGETHGLDGLINLFGIESPGLTSALAIGQMVANAIQSNNAEIPLSPHDL